MTSNKPVICMISCRHHLLDDRIYKKQAVSLQKNGFQVVHIGYGTEYKRYTTGDGIEIIQLQKQYKGHSLKSFYRSLKQSRMNDIFTEAAKTQACIYHLHDVELCRIALKLKKLAHRPQVIYDAHEPYPENLKDYWKDSSWVKLLLSDIPAVLAEKRILKKVDYLIATEKNVASRFAKHNPNSAIIYNYSFFEPESVPFPDKKYDLIYCGSISEMKGVKLIVDTLIYAKEKGISLSCLFVGSFPTPALENRIKEIIKKNGLANNVIFTGELPIEEINRYYKESKIGLCIFPKDNSTRLILPIKLFEYMSFGLPIIGSNFGHIKEIIEENDAGIAVDPYDKKSILKAALELLDKNGYESYFTRNTTAVKEKYLWKKEEGKLLDIYKKCESRAKSAVRD